MLEQFHDPETADTAARRWFDHPEWMAGPPPDEIMEAWLHPAAPLDGGLIGLARSWDAPPFTVALLRVLDDDEEDEERQRRAAWLLKVAGAPEAWREFAKRALTTGTDRVTRRYLIEALDRLAFARAIGWAELEPVVVALAVDPDPQIRSGTVGVLMSLPRAHDLQRSLLLRLLDDEDDSVVTGAAVALRCFNLAASDFDPRLVQRLREHPNPGVRAAVTDLLA